jgi:MoaA/NifB/PqqE/SkfB family radical SAM enzyme
MQAISLCHVHGIPVYLNMVVTRANRAELEAMAVLASRLGCAALGYGHCQPTPDALAANLVLSARERRDVEADIAALQQMFTMPIVLAGDHYTASRFAQCPQLHMQEFNIDYRGYLTACCMLSNYRGGTPDTDVLADLRTVSFVEAHRHLIAKIAQINLEKLDRLATCAPTEAEQFLCTHCLLHYQKVPQLTHILVPPSRPSVAPVEEMPHAHS